MAKRINSEYKIKDDTSNFNVKMGTSNKKNPEVIYTTLTSYITPVDEDENYDFLLSIDKDIKKYIKALITNYNDCEKEIITVVDIAMNRVVYNKPSFLDVQIYFKPKKTTLISNNYNFITVSTKLYNNYVSYIMDYIDKILNNNGFISSKTKINTIYTEN